jgi:DNA-nicking Smr family endonuclease
MGAGRKYHFLLEENVDFGDILEQWDHETSIPQGKKAARDKSGGGRKTARLQATVPRIHPLTNWLENNEVYDKDAAEPELHGGKAAVSAGEKRRRLLLRKPDATIDLHGLTRDEAWTALEAFFQDARARGFCKVIIIHGKGNHSQGGAILRHAVRDFVERCSFAGESGYGSASFGGSGATWVLLK